MKEIWKTIKDYPDYQVSNLGRVESFKKCYDGRMLKQKISNGYYSVVLYNENGRKTKRIHTLVWDAFGDAPRNGIKLQVDHIDENKLNNHIDNLQLLTNSANTLKSIKHNTYQTALK